MPVLCLGVSYRRAPVELLERLAFDEEDYGKAYRRLRDLGAVRESVILSTCNRVEVFAEVSSYHAGFLELKRFLSEAREVPADEFADPLYSHYEEDAVRHLHAVAAGIDSMVLGEPQILSQVRAAYRQAEAEDATGPILSALFRGAIRTGRRVRSETAIGASPAAMVQAGAALAAEAIGGLAGRSAVVVGAGGMAGLAATHLREAGVERLRVVNRSVDRARKVAHRAGAEASGLDRLVHAIADADIVISSTGAAGTLIGVDTVRAATRSDRRRRGPLFLVDLAVPRDVEPAVARLPGVRLADIDDLKARLAGIRADAAGEIDRAEEIVRLEAARFAAWRRAYRLAPLIQALRERGERILAAEMARALPKLGELSDRERAAVDSLARGIVAKLLHEPIVRLKHARPAATGDQLARAMAELFGLDLKLEP